MVFWDRLGSMPSTDGLYCTMLYGDSMSCNGNHFTFGAAADSAYEYMLKQWILTNGTDKVHARWAGAWGGGGKGAACLWGPPGPCGGGGLACLQRDVEMEQRAFASRA